MTTKSSIRVILCMTAVALLAACGDGKNTASSSPTVDQKDALPIDFSTSLYAFDKETKIVSIDGQSVTIPAGTVASLIETRDDAKYGRLVHLGFDTDENSELPSDLWLPDSTTLESSMSPAMELEKQYYCYRYVKQYLLKAGLVHVYLPGSYAAQAYQILPKYGFHITGHSPHTALIGEVCVYSGGPQGYGHIEVLRPGGWWYGYGYIKHPIQNRHFMACFTK